MKHADYVTVGIGSNDLLRAFADGSVVPEEVLPVLTNLKNIILNIKNLTDKPIVVYNIYNPFQVGLPEHNVADFLLPSINMQIMGLIAQLRDNNVAVADAYSAFGQEQAKYIILGDIHPTVEGQKKLAEIGLKALGLD